MSLEEATKELERLELQMQQRSGNRELGDEREESKRGLVPGEGEGWLGVGGKAAVQAAVSRGESRGRGKANEKPHGDVEDLLRRERSVSIEGRKRFSTGRGEAHDEGEDRKEEDRPQREPSPTRVHLHRTGPNEKVDACDKTPRTQLDRFSGSIDIERGFQREAPSRSWSHDTAGFNASGVGRSDTAPSLSNRFEAIREKVGADVGRWARDSPWRTTSVLDRDEVGRSSSISGESMSFSAVGGRGVGESSRGVSKGWRTEADTDLSDIKATMRRIDGATVSTARYTTNTFGLDASTSTSATTAATATAAVSNRPAYNAPAAAARSLDREAFRNTAVSRAYNNAYEGRTGAGFFPWSIAGDGGGVREGGLDSDRTAGWGASGGSKAVLSALRALQDKIRKLESERDRASVEAGNLRREIAALQSHHERAAQVSEAVTQEKTLASRLAYERLQADKVAADVRLRKAEEHKRLLVREAENAKGRSAAAEAARQTAESRVRTLEDRLLGLGRQEEKTSAAEAGAKEEAAKKGREKADRVQALRSKVAQMEASVTEERTLREDAERGLARALSDKSKLERFLEGILRVNEELVKAAGVGAFSGGDVKCKRVKRPKAIKGSSAKTGSAVASACCCGVGGGCKGYDFNVGTHTAKRASVRARKVKQTKRSTAAAAAFAGDLPDHLPDPPARGVPGHASGLRRKPACKASKKKSAGAGTGGRKSERAVPFVASGRGAESYNVVSAVSKAVRTARIGRPRESLDALYAEIGDAMIDSTKDVAFMFGGDSGTTSKGQQQARCSRKTTARNSRTVLDVAMPDLRGLSLDLPSFTDRNGVEEDAETSASKQQWRQEWRQAVGLDAASPRSKRRSLRGRECPERHNKDDDAEAETCQRRERDVLFNERYEEGAKGGDEEENKEDREDGESRDLREEPARFLSREIPEKGQAGSGLSSTDTGKSSEDERKGGWGTSGFRA